MKFYIIIPAHNEEAYLRETLTSISAQSLLPSQIIVVNDNSTDNTEAIVNEFMSKLPMLRKHNLQSEANHMPGAKVMQAFYKGYEQLDEGYDVIMKLDADIILPPNYLQILAKNFSVDNKLGMCSGLCYVKKGDAWVYEPVADKKHIRGPIKAYSKACFKAIGGPKISIGWDTLDVLLAHYYGFSTKTIPELRVKHLKPTGEAYSKKARFLQGKAMYKMRYGFILTFIASLKTAFSQKRPQALINNIIGYLKAKKENTTYLVNQKEGRYIRDYRYRGILKKLFGN